MLRVLRIFIFVFIFINSIQGLLFSQIKVYERTTTDSINSGLSYISEKRIKINLNGKWQVSFNDGDAFAEFIIPCSYTFNGKTQFKKSFSISDSILKNFCFVLVAEGINYESEIKINNVFITKHTEGSSSIIHNLDENLLKNDNEIFIRIDNELDNSNSIPLANQINYSKNYGGISKNIYLIAVPKMYVFDNRISYQFENDNTIKIFNSIDINSENLTQLKIDNKEFFVKSLLIKKANNEISAESSPLKCSLEDYQSINLTNEFFLKNPALWSPETPELYFIKTIIFGSNNKVIDERVCETGFSSIRYRNDNILYNGKILLLNGINYYEDSPRFGSALDFEETEKDLKKIKEYGFNCIRTPGRTANPYLLTLCNRLGICLFQDISFNEVPSKLLNTNKYRQQGLDLFETIIKRDKNNPCIFAWGAGNDFDVTVISSAEYIKNAKELLIKNDSRPLYYTSRNLQNDKCQEFADIKGVNLTSRNIEANPEIIETLKKNSINGKFIFISSYGLSVTNDNRNGFGDIHSIDAQSRYLSESYKLFSKSFFGNFISSYADWNSETALNFPQNQNTFLVTNGIFDYAHEPKQSAALMKRVINNQGYQKIPEGSGEKLYSDNSYIFIIAGIISIILFILLLSKMRYFKDNIIKSIITQRNFIMFAKEQMLITTFRNILLIFFISLSLGLFFSSIIYYFRENSFFDMALANTFENINTKEIIAGVVNSPIKLLVFTTTGIFILISLKALVISLLNSIAARKSHFKAIYTITVWSNVPMLIFLIIGPIIYKLATGNSFFIKLFLILFIVLYIYCLVKLLFGVKIIFELSSIKAYLLGLIIIIFTFGIGFSYFYYFKSTISIISLILSYK